MWKKKADLYKRNGIKEVKIYQINTYNKNEKRLWDWEFYDREGRLIEKKRFNSNSTLKTHYKFEYPNNKSRILISLDSNGNELKRDNQNFDLSNENNTLKKFSDDGYFEYEYNDNGDITKVWRIKENPKLLQTENIYNENGYLVISKRLVFTKKRKSSFISINSYTLDENGNILKIITESKGIIRNVVVYEYEKYST